VGADFTKVLFGASLRDHQRFTREYLIPKYGDLLPK
jgi:hypothetical protein